MESSSQLSSGGGWFAKLVVAGLLALAIGLYLRIVMVDREQQGSAQIPQASMRIIESNYLLCKKTGLGKISYMGEDRIDGRDAWRIQGVFPKDDGFYAHKITLCFDKVLQLPVKITVCDESNRLIEEYIFRNLRINVGFKDRDFDPENPEYHFF